MRNKTAFSPYPSLIISEDPACRRNVISTFETLRPSLFPPVSTFRHSSGRGTTHGERQKNHPKDDPEGPPAAALCTIVNRCLLWYSRNLIDVPYKFPVTRVSKFSNPKGTSQVAAPLVRTQCEGGFFPHGCGLNWQYSIGHAADRMLSLQCNSRTRRVLP